MDFLVKTKTVSTPGNKYHLGTAMFNSACIAAYNPVLFVPILTFIFDQDVTGDQVCFSFWKMYADGT